MSIRRFTSIERKFSRNPSFKEQYVNFMQEYQDLGHMTVVNESQEQGVSYYLPHHAVFKDTSITTKTRVVFDASSKPDSVSYYLPHHAVFKDTSITTKTRVVFDASSKPDSGLALNDVLQVGPCIQDDIFSIMLRFRTHPIVFTADIAKMYHFFYNVTFPHSSNSIYGRYCKNV
ncbi:hypothetical protein QE152_g13489 [Popillia japonica]|uniref:Uncharacterized protein n=1 Tax=Popillia japonica TaxID=7064 RepID=A0AAW1LCX3_POPJA